MDDFYLGQTIRELRKQKNLTLEELAAGICSKRQLQRIETNATIPSADIIFKLSRKLNEDLKQYFKYSHLENPSEMAKLIQKFDNLYDARDYQTLYNLTKPYEDVDCKSADIIQIIRYYYAIAAVRLEISPIPDEQYFMFLLSLSIESPSEDTFFADFRTLLEYKLIYSYIAVKYFDDLYDKPEDVRTKNLNKAIELLKEIVFHYTDTYKNIDYNFVARIYNNIAHSYNILGDYESALYYADQALEQYVLFCSLSIVAMLHYVKGEAHVRLDQLELAKKSFRYFIKLHEMIGDAHFVAPLIQSLKDSYQL